MHVDYQSAKEALLKSIYGTDQITQDILEQDPSNYIKIANDKRNVVPIALLLSTGKLDYKTAVEKLAQDPIISNVIKQHTVHT